MEGPKQEVKIKAQACLNLSRCLLSALGDSSLVSACLQAHQGLIPDNQVDKLKQLAIAQEYHIRMGVEMVLERAVSDCKRITEDRPHRNKPILYDSVEKLLAALVKDKQPNKNRPHPSNSNIEAHLDGKVLLVSDIDRIGEKSLKLLRAWFKGSRESEALEIDVDVSKSRSPEYILFLTLSKAEVIGDEFDSSPVITYKGKSYKIYKFYDEEMISLKIMNLD